MLMSLIFTRRFTNSFWFQLNFFFLKIFTLKTIINFKKFFQTRKIGHVWRDLHTYSVCAVSHFPSLNQNSLPSACAKRQKVFRVERVQASSTRFRGLTMCTNFVHWQSSRMEWGLKSIFSLQNDWHVFLRSTLKSP